MRDSDKPLSQLAKDLGVSEQTLRTWRRQAQVDHGELDGLTSDQLEELRRLRRENRTLQSGAGGAEKSRGLLRSGERGAVGEVFAFIAAEKTDYPVSLMCRVLEVNRTAFHDWERRPPSDRALYDAFLTDKIRAIHAASGGTYGSPRVHAELRLEHGIRVGKKRVERLMAQAGLEGIPVPGKARTTVRVAGARVAPDLVERDFNPTAPNRLWCADITYLRTWEGWLYLASVLDCLSA